MITSVKSCDDTKLNKGEKKEITSNYIMLSAGSDKVGFTTNSASYEALAKLINRIVKERH